MKPLIGLPGRRKSGSQIDGFEGVLSPLDIDIYLADYSRGVLQAGGLPVNIPMDADPADYVPHLHGILLTGGADVEPGHYQQEPDGNGGYEADRDELELALYDSATLAGLPVLGICRGLQVMNVAAGGSLHQHVPEHSRYDVAVDASVHEVNFEPGSQLGSIYGERAAVNSLHHQTVDRVGADFTISARAEDGTVEGLEHPVLPTIAVQWHPEMLDNADPVFSWLVEQAKAYAARG